MVGRQLLSEGEMMKFYNLYLLFKLFLVCVFSLNFQQTIHASHDEPSTLINARTAHDAVVTRILIERGEVTNRYAVLDKTETLLSAKGQNTIDKALNDINGIAAAIQMDLRSFITWAHQKHVMITEENRLRDAIDTAVSAIKRQHLKVDLWILAYHLAWSNYNMEIQSYNSHESHQGSTSGDLTVAPHVKNWKVRREFSDYKCEGDCDIIFDSPGEAETSHQVTCGSDFYVVWHLIDGCGREYYKCPGHDVPNFHDVFRCTKHNKSIKDGKRVNVYCGKHFRTCTNYVMFNGEYTSPLVDSPD